MAPTEFWAMHPQEFWWLLEAWGDQSSRSSGNLTHSEHTRLSDMLKDAKEKHAKGEWLQ